MTLSIIIVNYNVKFFLEQCLHAVQKAITNINAEIFVIDNDSTDDSLAYLQPLFPHVIFIGNKKNVGFAKACNQGLAWATGQYILFLNPDTIVKKNTFEQCIYAFEQNDNIGAIGVKMLDGNGQYLKESKRGFPSPLASFYKITGFTSLFPRSAHFAKYYLGNLNADENNIVDVLAGAYMMIRKKVLDATGGFDETFFMYGEDIDLSYRILQAGYKNYYLADAPIIHFKGESTDKNNIAHIKNFYGAMHIFVKKHYTGAGKTIYSFLLRAAIGLVAGVHTLRLFFRRRRK